jgi:hypothetical protein
MTLCGTGPDGVRAYLGRVVNEHQRLRRRKAECVPGSDADKQADAFLAKSTEEVSFAVGCLRRRRCYVFVLDVVMINLRGSIDILFSFLFFVSDAAMCCLFVHSNPKVSVTCVAIRDEYALSF